MISGVTLLGKVESIRDVYLKRVLRMVLVILILTFLQYLRIVRVYPENGFSLVTYLAYCYSGNIIEPYWFLKSYLSMLLILPLLCVLAQNMKKEHFYLLLGIRMLATLITVIEFGIGYGMNVTLLTNTDFVFYPLMGYYLGGIESEENAGRKRTVYSCLAADCTFGLYVIEDVVRNQIEKLMQWIRPVCGPMTACLLFVLMSTVVGLAVIWLVRKLPYVNKLI